MSEEFLISPENLLTYLREHGLFESGSEVKIRELGGGVSNIVLLVEADGVRWVAKQSLGKLRVEANWHSSRERIFREADSLEALGPPLGESTLPSVIHRDPDHYFFIMTAAPEGSRMWKNLLLEGQVDSRIARRAGTTLAQLGNSAAGKESVRKRFEDRTVFDELRLDPYYRVTAARHPDLREKFDRLIADSLEIRTGLVHGDYSPKNMLVREGGMFLIVFEVIHWGDPTFDTGFFLNHLFLKSFHGPQFALQYFRAVREFWKGFVEGRAARARELELMTIRHLGCLMLARIDGKSPAEYIQDEGSKDRVRKGARRIILEEPGTLEDVISIVQSGLERN